MVKLLYCYACQIHTNHHKTASGEWVCWCGSVENEREAQAAEIARDAEWLGTAQIDPRPESAK